MASPLWNSRLLYVKVFCDVISCAWFGVLEVDSFSPPMLPVPSFSKWKLELAKLGLGARCA